MCIWMWLCCGCLPLLGLMIGLVFCFPVCVLWTIGMSAISIVMVPPLFFNVYRAIIQTKRWGINIKVRAVRCVLSSLSLTLALRCVCVRARQVVAFILAPIPILLWPFVVIFCSVIAGFWCVAGARFVCALLCAH